MKKFTNTLLAAGFVAGAFTVQAQENPISANFALTTDYIYRGISQTSGGPALQGGFDYAHESGFYVGTWASSITFDDAIEIDYYGGFTGSLTDGLEYDIGFLYYDYPGASNDDFLEFYAGLTYAGLTGKVARSNDFFGGSGEAYYYTLDYGISIMEGLELGLHYGYSDFDQEVFGTKDSYTDFVVSLGTSVAGVDLSVAWTDTTLSSSDCGSSDCDSTITFAVAKSF
jgi:uncharacterized protein (TIGR02001 family)